MAGDIQIPFWLKGFLSEQGFKEIQSCVAETELKTQAEVVPMIVRSSSTRGFLPFQIFLIFSLISVVFFRELPYGGVFALIVLSFPVSVALSSLAWVQRLLIPKADQIQDVFHRAHFEFHKRKLAHTEGHTGVLVFVSLNERRAVVLADEAIAKKLNEKVWSDAIEKLLQGIKNKKTAVGFCDAIKHCTDFLTQHAPARAENPNEISNHLIIEE